jgi:Predicted dinucleotide-binding enzymes
MGSTLALKLIKLGHNVSIANSRGQASLQKLAREKSEQKQFQLKKQ